jgi:riboflavin biosynthesis pyrimidine reductase
VTNLQNSPLRGVPDSQGRWRRHHTAVLYGQRHDTVIVEAKHSKRSHGLNVRDLNEVRDRMGASFVTSSSRSPKKRTRCLQNRAL